MSRHEDPPGNGSAIFACRPDRHSYRWLALVVLVTLALVAPACIQTPAPDGAFVEEVVFSGLAQPTAVRFARDGRVFVAVKSGVIKVFDGLT